MNRELIYCQFCQKSNLCESYHDKQGFAYCANCYWEKDEYTKKIAKNRSWDFYVGTTIYRNCPYCGHGDTCGEDHGRINCIAKYFNFFHPEGSSGCGCWERKKEHEEQEKKKRQEEWKERQQQQDEAKEEKQHEKWVKIAEEIHSLLQKSKRDFEDHQQIKKLQKETDSLLKEVKDDNPLKELLKDCQKSLENLEKETPHKDYSKCLHNGESATNFPVRHDDTSIQWSRKKDEEPFCVDCGASNDNSERFLRSFSHFCRKIIQDWLNANKINHISNAPLPLETKELYINLIHGRKFPCVSDIKEAYWKIEKEIDKLSDKKNLVSISKRNIEREREREREQIHTQQSTLRTQIQQLESKTSKSPQEEAELTSKKKELAELEKKLKELESQEKNQKQGGNKENKHLGLKIGIGALVGVVLVGLVVILVRRKKGIKNK